MIVQKSRDTYRPRVDGDACHHGLGNEGHGEPRGCQGALSAVNVLGHGRFILCASHETAIRAA